MPTRLRQQIRRGSARCKHEHAVRGFQRQVGRCNGLAISHHRGVRRKAKIADINPQQDMMHAGIANHHYLVDM